MEEENVENSSSKAKRRGGRKKRKDNSLNKEITDNDSLNTLSLDNKEYLNKTEEEGASTNLVTDKTNNVNRQRSKSREKVNLNVGKEESQIIDTSDSKSHEGNSSTKRKGNKHSRNNTEDQSASITDKKNKQRSKSREKDVNKKESQNIDLNLRSDEGDSSTKQKGNKHSYNETEDISASITSTTDKTGKKNKRRNKSREKDVNKKDIQNIDKNLGSDEGDLSTKRKGNNCSKNQNQSSMQTKFKEYSDDNGSLNTSALNNIEGISNETSALMTDETDYKNRRSKSREKDLNTNKKDSQSKHSDSWNWRSENKGNYAHGQNNQEQHYKDNFSTSPYPKNTSRSYRGKGRQYNNVEQNKFREYSNESAGNVPSYTSALENEGTWEINASMNSVSDKTDDKNTQRSKSREKYLNTDKKDSQNTDSWDSRFSEDNTKQKAMYGPHRGGYNQDRRYNNSNQKNKYKNDDKDFPTSFYPDNRTSKGKQYNQYGPNKSWEHSNESAGNVTSNTSTLNNEDWFSGETLETNASMNSVTDITDDKNTHRSKSREKNFNTNKRDQNTDSRDFRSFDRSTRSYGPRRGRNQEQRSYYNERNDYKDDEKNERKMNELFKFKEKNGDLFTASKEYSLAHCVAEDFRMGAGIAVTFRKTFHRVDELLSQYKRTGEVAVLSDSNRFIYYLVTKKFSYEKPTYRSLEESLREMKLHCVENNVKMLAMPKIGCGLDLLEWNRVENIICKLFGDMEIEIVVYNYQKKRKRKGSNNKCSRNKKRNYGKQS